MYFKRTKLILEVMKLISRCTQPKNVHLGFMSTLDLWGCSLKLTHPGVEEIMDILSFKGFKSP